MGRGNAICPDTSSRSHSIAVESQNPGTAYHKVFPARTSSAIFSTNKGDVLNCCGKMPSLRRAGLPGSFNLPKQFGTVQAPHLLTNGGQLWRIDGSPVELITSNRDLRRDRFREWNLKS